MNIARRPSLAIAACTSLVIALCGIADGVAQNVEPAPGAEVTGDTILFGQTAAQSGPNAPTGEAKWGLDAFVKSVNAKGGVKGKKLQVISYDDSYQPAQTTALVKKLVYQDQVFAMVGSIGSPTNAAVYKTLWLDRMVQTFGWVPVAAYGNADTDITAYQNAGIPKSQTFIVGPLAGNGGTQPIDNLDYTSHISTYVNAQPDNQ